MSLGPVYAGTVVTTTATFTVPPSGELTDPSSVVLKFKVGGTITTWTYLGVGTIARVSAGTYRAELDTTNSSARSWSVEWIGTGSCAAVAVVQFQVNPVPF